MKFTWREFLNSPANYGYCFLVSFFIILLLIPFPVFNNSSSAFGFTKVSPQDNNLTGITTEIYLPPGKDKTTSSLLSEKSNTLTIDESGIGIVVRDGKKLYVHGGGIKRN